MLNGMSVNRENTQQAQDNINNILSELSLIEQLSQERQMEYQQCLNKFMNHLEKQTDQFTKRQETSQKRNSAILSSFQAVYEGIMSNADLSIRDIRNTYEAKRKFWKTTITDFASYEDLDFKKELYLLEKDTEEKYEDSIEALKGLSKIPFIRLLKKKEANNTLSNFQQTNNKLELKVYLNNTAAGLKNTYYGNNKENSGLTNRGHERQTPMRQKSQSEHILNSFMKI